MVNGVIRLLRENAHSRLAPLPQPCRVLLERRLPGRRVRWVQKSPIVVGPLRVWFVEPFINRSSTQHFCRQIISSSIPSEINRREFSDHPLPLCPISFIQSYVAERTVVAAFFPTPMTSFISPILSHSPCHICLIGIDLWLLIDISNGTSSLAESRSSPEFQSSVLSAKHVILPPFNLCFSDRSFPFNFRHPLGDDLSFFHSF
jgi:hypothetical protein